MSGLINQRFPASHDQPATLAHDFRCANGIVEFGGNKIAQSIPQELNRLREPYGARIALVAPNHDSLTYADLFRHVTDIVDALNDLGIGRGDRVALALADGLKMAIGFLGLSAGATCAPLNPAFPPAEFDTIFHDLAPKALIVDAGVDCAAVTAAQKRSIPIIELSAVEENGSGRIVICGETLAPPSHTGFAGAADVALILFTSGTTARPKLVPLTHAKLIASARNIAAALQLSPNDRSLNVMPLFHIHGLIGGLLASLVSGGSVVCPPKFAAADFFTCLELWKPNWYTAVPAMHQAILAEAPAHAATIHGSPLRFIRSSSSALPVRVLADLETVFNAPVIESYGMTEASHQIASNPLPPATRKPASVGKSAGPEIAIMDEAGNLQPAGTVGEVVIRGDNVMVGYADNAAANAVAFTQGWFRTGDQGYLDDEGYLFLTGRIKELINRGGEKISPREIDEVLLAHPKVGQAATFALPHPTLGEEVAAAVVLRTGMAATVREISAFIGTQLADFKTPKQILFVNEIPRSATGKLQRSRLAELFASRLQGETRTAETQLESMLAAIYAEVLGVEVVDATDNFFALGGDSLRATQIIGRVRARLEVDLSIAAVFRNPTVADLAMEIVRVMADADEGAN
jgi:acyl-CoA synthetase (AMP-forming)/AMP-acid ligase II/acyl carrier protein